MQAVPQKEKEQQEKVNVESLAYLGDGCYAAFDGNGVVLRAGDHRSQYATDTVYLDDEVLQCLLLWLKDLGVSFP